MPVQFSFSAVVDSFERDEDRIAVRFADRAGLFWVATDNGEVLGPLKRSLQTGQLLELTYDVESLELTDSREL